MSGFTILAELLRTDSRSFLMKEHPGQKKDRILAALEQAGFELILQNKVTRKTKKIFEQPVFSKTFMVAAGNTLLRKIEKEKYFPLVREKE